MRSPWTTCIAHSDVYCTQRCMCLSWPQQCCQDQYIAYAMTIGQSQRKYLCSWPCPCSSTVSSASASASSSLSCMCRLNLLGFFRLFEGGFVWIFADSVCILLSELIALSCCLLDSPLEKALVRTGMSNLPLQTEKEFVCLRYNVMRCDTNW